VNLGSLVWILPVRAVSTNNYIIFRNANIYELFKDHLPPTPPPPPKRFGGEYFGIFYLFDMEI
jgi:hypothetical protein